MVLKVMGNGKFFWGIFLSVGGYLKRIALDHSNTFQSLEQLSINIH